MQCNAMQCNAMPSVLVNVMLSSVVVWRYCAHTCSMSLHAMHVIDHTVVIMHYLRHSLMCSLTHNNKCSTGGYWWLALPVDNRL